MLEIINHFTTNAISVRQKLVYCIQTIKIGDKTIENAQVLTCPNCSQIDNED